MGSGLLLTIKAEDGDLQKIETLLDRIETVLTKPVKADLSKLTAQVAALDKESKEASLSAASMQANFNSLSAKSLKTSQDVAKLTGNLSKNEAVINVLTASFSAYVEALSKSSAHAEKVNAAHAKQRTAAQELLGAMEALSVVERQQLVTDQALVGVTNLLNKEMAVQVELATIEAASKSALIASMKAETVVAAKLLLEKGLISEARFASITGIQKEIPSVDVLAASYTKLAIAEQESTVSLRSNMAAQLGATRIEKRTKLTPASLDSVTNLRAEAAALETRNSALAEGVRLRALKISGSDKELAAIHKNNQALATQARRLGLITKEEYKAAMAQKTFTTTTKQAAFSANKLTSALRGVSGGLGALWLTYGSMLPMLATFATVTAAIKGLKSASSFEYQLKYMVSLGKATKDTTATYENLYDGILAISGVSQGPTELADSVKVLMKAGFDAATALDEVKVIAQLATVAEEGLDEVTSALMSQYRAWSVEMVGPERGLRSLADAANIIGYASLDATLDIKEMLGQFKYTSELAKLSGASFVELAASLGILSDVGITNTKAATSLRTAIKQLQNPTKQTRKLFKDMKIDFDLAAKDGSLLTLTELFSNFSDTIKDLPSADRMKVLNQVFSLRAASAGSMLTAVSIDDLKRIDEQMQLGNFSLAKRVERLKEVQKEGSFVADMYRDLAKTNTVLWEETKAAWEKAAIKGTGTDDLKGLIVSLKDFADSGTVETLSRGVSGLSGFLMGVTEDFVDLLSAPAVVAQSIENIYVSVKDAIIDADETALASINAAELYRKQMAGTLGKDPVQKEGWGEGWFRPPQSKALLQETQDVQRLEKAYGSLEVAVMAAPLDKKIAKVVESLSDLDEQTSALAKNAKKYPNNPKMVESFAKSKAATYSLTKELKILRLEKARMLSDPEAWKAEQEAAEVAIKKTKTAIAEVYKVGESDKITIAKLRQNEQKAQDAFELQMLGDQQRSKQIAEEEHKDKVYQIKRRAAEDNIKLLIMERDAAAEVFKDAEAHAGQDVAVPGAEKAAETARDEVAALNSQIVIAQKEFSQLATLRLSDMVVTDVTKQREYIATSLELRKSQIDREKTLTMTSIKQEGSLLEARKKAGLIIESEFIEEKRKLREEEFDAEEAALTEQVDRLKDKRAEMLKIPGVKETDTQIRQMDNSIAGVVISLAAVEKKRGVFDELVSLEDIDRAEKLRKELEKIVEASDKDLADTEFDLSIRTQAPKKQDQSRELRGISLEKDQKISELGEMYEGEELDANVEKVNQAYAQITENAESSFAQQAEASHDFWGGLSSGVNSYLEEASDIFAQASDFASSSFGKIGDTLSEVVATGKADFKSLLQSVIADAAQMLLKLALVKAMQAAIGAIAGDGGGGAAGGGAGGGSAGGAAAGAVGSAIGSAAGGSGGGGAGWVGSLVSIAGSLFGSAANGAIWDGHFQPLQEFASGATNISRPTVGVVGEGKYPEAIVPLPDGRSIPARVEGLGDSMNKAMDKIADKINPAAGQGGTKIVNVLDPAMAKGYLSTREGEKLVVNIMRENKGALA